MKLLPLKLQLAGKPDFYALVRVANAFVHRASVRPKPAGTMHNCIGYSDERIEIWFARELQFQGQQLDAGEFLQIHTATLADLLQRAREGTLTDAKTLTALLWAQQLASGAWQLDWQSSSQP